MLNQEYKAAASVDFHPLDADAVSAAPFGFDRAHSANEGSGYWRWTEDFGRARDLSMAIADLATASSIAAVNVSVQASREAENGDSLQQAADDLDRLSAQTREAAQKLVELVEELQTDVISVMEATWTRLELAEISPADV